MSIETPGVPGTAPVVLDRKGQVYQPAVGPYLKPLLALLFVGFAFLGATGAYMVAIRLLNAIQDATHDTYFKLWIDLAHLAFGVLIVVPFLIFGVVHWRSARTRKNRRAVTLGKALFFTGLIVCVSGLALMQLHNQFQLPTKSIGRWIMYGLHLATPILAVGLYVMHRRAGPDIQWRWGIGWGGSVAVFLASMVFLHSKDPRGWYLAGPKDGDRYFHPSAARTSDGKFVRAETFMMDDYCMKCHEDIYKDHLHSAHRMSSFNNPAYLFSVRETRKVSLERDGKTNASRWCAGCHDPVPFFSGQFDDPKFDDVNNPTAHAGITCTVCHAMTHVNSAKGNGDYVIEEPLHYPFAQSQNLFLQYVNNQMVKAKPDFHKTTFLKPFHKTAEFCSTCHKVSLPVELNQYKEFLRGQNHYDPYLLSGVSGGGARAFYYPPEAKTNCAECHMPLRESKDFGAKDFDKSGIRKVHNHLFPAANTGLPWMLMLRPDEVRGPMTGEGFKKAAFTHADFLRGTDPEGKDKKLRIDLFGVRDGGTLDGKLSVLRPALPKLKPGGNYLVEVVVRTVGLGHPFSQGTVDSNEIWVEFQAQQGNTIVGRNGHMLDQKTTKGEQKIPERNFMVLDDRPVDKWAHFINVHMLDRHGNRINRRNPQDIFTPLYNKQIPPGAGQVLHYALTVPQSNEPLTLKVRLRYRKFDFEYMALVHGKDGKPDESKVPALPVVDICEDSVTLALEGGAEVKEQVSPIKPPWQRWNDYGIGLLLAAQGDDKKPGLLQAREVFKKVADWDDKAAKSFGLLNLARVAFEASDLNGCADLLNQAKACDPPAPLWTVAWLSARVNIENGRIVQAIEDLEKLLEEKAQPRERKFDFRRDYVLINVLADAYWKLSQAPNSATRDQNIRKAIGWFEKTLAIDPEDLDAHFGLKECYARLGEPLSKQATPSAEDAGKDIDKLEAIFVDRKASTERRMAAALALGEAVTEMGKKKFQVATKLPTCNGLWKQVGKVFRDDSEAQGVKTAAAFVLRHVHRELHATFKPDDLADSAAKQRYRSRPENKAADHASHAIVYYPVQKP